jgi:predicted transposase YdaD
VTPRPHDALFKAAFEAPEHATGLLRGIVPPTLNEAIHWDTLTQEPGSFIKPSLADQHSDLLFSVQLGHMRALLYVLLEHQSTNDEFMPLRMLSYLARICERHRKAHGAPLPLIIPVVVSHAPDGWTGPTTFGELFDPHPESVPGLAALVPSFSLIVHDLAHLSDEDLHEWALAAFPKLSLWLLRDGRDGPRLLRNFEQWVDALREVLHAPHGLEAVAQLLRYIALVCGGMQFEKFREKIREQVPEAEEVAMTIAEQLRKEGMEKGRKEGRQEGRQESLVRMLGKQLTLKFGELPPEHAARIEAATSEDLERYIERILSAGTIEAVFAN